MVKTGVVSGLVPGGSNLQKKKKNTATLIKPQLENSYNPVLLSKLVSRLVYALKITD